MLDALADHWLSAALFVFAAGLAALAWRRRGPLTAHLAG